MFWGPWSDICKGHSCHGGELMFVFNNIIAIQNATEEERTLASKMNAHWANFVTTGDPNTPGVRSRFLLSPNPLPSPIRSKTLQD